MDNLSPRSEEYLQRILDPFWLEQGHLSGHTSELEAGGLIEVKKSFRGKRPLTELYIVW